MIQLLTDNMELAGTGFFIRASLFSCIPIIVVIFLGSLAHLSLQKLDDNHDAGDSVQLWSPWCVDATTCHKHLVGNAGFGGIAFTVVKNQSHIVAAQAQRQKD